MRSILVLLIFSLTSIASADYKGRIVTDVGTIGIRLYASSNLMSMNFMELALGRKRFFDVSGKRQLKPFYNGLIFHRAHPDLGIFSGCPLGNGRGWPGFMIPAENLKDAKFDRPGLIAMAKVEGDSDVGSQFFITTKAQPRLDGRFPVFGEVTSGMEVVQKIAAAQRDVLMKPLKPIHIKQIEIDGF